MPINMTKALVFKKVFIKFEIKYFENLISNFKVLYEFCRKFRVEVLRQKYNF